jgi:hypothetical protein
MPSETKRHPSELRQVAHAADMPRSIQIAVQVIEAKTKIIDLMHEDLARKRDEIARLKLERDRLKITIADLKAYIARKASGHG